MGMGEPLDNYDNVMKFLDLVSSDDGLNIGKGILPCQPVVLFHEFMIWLIESYRLHFLFLSMHQLIK